MLAAAVKGGTSVVVRAVTWVAAKMAVAAVAFNKVGSTRYRNCIFIVRPHFLHFFALIICDDS